MIFWNQYSVFCFKPDTDNEWRINKQYCLELLEKGCIHDKRDKFEKRLCLGGKGIVKDTADSQ